MLRGPFLYPAVYILCVHMKRYAIVEKRRGETPLAALTSWKAAHPAYAAHAATYAGRLDPMAEGALLILLGDECKRKPAYTKLDKEYEIEVLLGARTDTGDLLGMPERSPAPPDLSLLREALRSELGTQERAYPRFSSKAVSGKPLFMHALEKTGAAVPTHHETIYRIDRVGSACLSAPELKERVLAALSRAPASDEPTKALGADFRIGTIRPAWDRALTDVEQEFTILSLRVACGSGTYMRTLAERIGERLGTYGCAYAIRRTKIGRYWKLPGLWVRTLR